MCRGGLSILKACSYIFLPETGPRKSRYLEFCRAKPQCMVLHTLVLMYSCYYVQWALYFRMLCLHINVSGLVFYTRQLLICSELWTLREKCTIMQRLRLKRESLKVRLLPFSTSSSESFNGRLTFNPLFVTFVGRQGCSIEQEEDDDPFERSMDLDVEPGHDAKGIRIFPLEEATESFLSQALSSAPGKEATAGAFWEAKPPQGNDSSARQCDASTDVVSSQGKRQGAGKDPDVLSQCLCPTSPLCQRGQ